MRKIIADGYILDPVNVVLFAFIGFDEEGRRIWRTLRGTNALEGLHKHLKELMKRHFITPELAYHIVTRFLARWNIARARDYRGRNDGVPTYEQAILERINMLHYELFNTVYYHIPCTYDHVLCGHWRNVWD